MRHLSCLGLLVFVLTLELTPCDASADAKRLYEELLRNRGYNKLIRPVGNNSDTLIVYLGLQLSQLIDVDEKFQIITTNVWLRHVWNDYKLQWNPKEYGNIELLYVPSKEIWLPDIVLYNNADGNYEVTLTNTKATVRHNGRIEWTPPAIYKSSCLIDVEYFPFDTQECYMKFGSWTYDGNEVNLKHLAHMRAESEEVERQTVVNGIDLRNYYQSVEWDVLKVPAQKNMKKYPCCDEPYMDITFNITLRRKTLFYTVNLIVPCVSISFLTVLVFYLPSDSGEKIALCLSILLSLTVFFLLLAEIIPPTSLVVPLIGKYLLFTMILVTLSIIVTVCVLNVHFRSPSTHTMSPWVKKVFLQILPRLLLMRRPHTHEQDVQMEKAEKGASFNFFGDKSSVMRARRISIPVAPTPYARPMEFRSEVDPILQSLQRAEEHSARCKDCGGLTIKGNSAEKFNNDVLKALEGVRFIAGHLRCEDETQKIKEDWKYVAMVLDRLFLWIFTSACLLGTMGIILQAPTLYDTSEALSALTVNQGVYSSPIL